MSKVSIEFDTKTDELSVSVDGKPLKDVCSVNIYSYEYEEEREVSINIGMCSKPEDEEDLRTYTSLSASVKEDIGPISIVNKQVYSDIANFINIGNNR